MDRQIAQRGLTRVSRILDRQPDNGPALALWLVLTYHANQETK